MFFTFLLDNYSRRKTLFSNQLYSSKNDLVSQLLITLLHFIQFHLLFPFFLIFIKIDIYWIFHISTEVGGLLEWQYPIYVNSSVLFFTMNRSAYRTNKVGDNRLILLTHWENIWEGFSEILIHLTFLHLLSWHNNNESFYPIICWPNKIRLGLDSCLFQMHL